MMNTDTIREQAAREFDSRPALAAEFSSKESYVCYRAAMARGAARIFGQPAASPAAHSASGARVDGVSAAPGQLSMNIQVGRAVARDDREAIKAVVREFQQTHRPGSYRLDEVAGFIVERAGLTQAQAEYAHAQSCGFLGSVM